MSATSPNVCTEAVKLRRLRDEAELELLQVAAARDNHLVIGPTFLVEGPGAEANGAPEILGYVGYDSFAWWQGWLDRGRVTARESVKVFRMVEDFARMNGRRELGLLLPSDSAFTSQLVRFGYKKIAGGLEWHLKKL